MTEVIVLNTDEAYSIDVTSISDVLTSGLYVKEDPVIIKGFAAATHTLALVTSAAEVRALHIVYSAGGYALWKVYQQPTGEPEAFYGYLAVKITATGTVCSIDATNTLGDDTIEATDWAEAVVAYFAAPDVTYTSGDDVADDIDTAKTKVRFVEA